MVGGGVPVAEVTRERGQHDRPRVAVLSKKPLAHYRYDRWLAEFDIDAVLFAEDTPADRAFLADVPHDYPVEPLLFPEWKRNRSVDEAVCAAYAARPFDRIVALSECDLVRAAELRAHLRIPGQNPESATAFRDKSVMKSLAAAAGLRVPDHRLVESVGDLMDFADCHPHGVVVKPVDGSGAAEVTVLRHRSEIEAWIRSRALPCDEPTGYLAEEWVAAPMLSVDGLMRDGYVVAVMVGAYTTTCLRSLTDLAPHGILSLDPGDSRVAAAHGYLTRLLLALPAAAEPMSFHCELFDHPEYGPMLCEIACRTGGGNLNAIARESLGIDLERAACLGQAGLAVPVPRAVPDPARRYGDIVVPRSPRRLPRGAACDLPGVVRFTAQHDDGPRRAAKVSDCMADALLVADDHAGVRRVYDSVTSWLDEYLPPEPGKGR